MIKVKWTDKSTKSSHVIHLDNYDVTRIVTLVNRKNSINGYGKDINEIYLTNSLNCGDVVDTGLHTYQLES